MGGYEAEKKLAAQKALNYLENGIVLGAGSGSTIRYFLEGLGERVEKGLEIQAVPTSKETRRLCCELGIPLYQGSVVPEKIDLTVDGADEFDGDLNLIKGGGGYLLWEKIVASASKRVIIIVDSGKRAAVLGEAFRLPIEVIPYALDVVKGKLAGMGIIPDLRMGAVHEPYRTDEGNYILDCAAGSIEAPGRLASALDHMTGVVEHGLFIGMADMIIEAKDGRIQTYEAKKEPR